MTLFQFFNGFGNGCRHDDQQGMHTALNAVFQYVNGLKHSLQIAKLILLKCTEVRKNSFYKLRNNPSYQAFVFPALHIFDIKMPYCVIVPNSTTYTHTVACAMMIILRGKEALSRRNDAIYWQPRLFIMAQDREWWSRQLHISRDGSFRLDNNSR